MAVKRSEITITGIRLAKIEAGVNLGRLVAAAARSAGIPVAEKDIFVVAQKVVSKAEGCLVRLGDIEASSLARRWGTASGKDPRLVEVILQASRKILRMEQGLLIAETRHGFVCANAGVDTSNLEEDWVSLLPEDPDRSARAIREELESEFQVPLGVIISDTFGRPWREGLTNVALGVSGMVPIMDYRGEKDYFDQTLQVTQVAVADELASAAELVMGKATGVPVALIRGFDYAEGEDSARLLIRPPERDLFR